MREIINHPRDNQICQITNLLNLLNLREIIDYPPDNQSIR